MVVVDFYGTTSTFLNTKLKHGKFSKNIMIYMKTVNFPYYEEFIVSFKREVAHGAW